MDSKSLIFGDLHFGTNNREDRTNYLPWLLEQILSKDPNTIIFNGDIFELILPIDHKTGLAGKNSCRVLEEIIDSWDDFFNFLTRSEVQRFVFLTGEHDYELKNSDVAKVLRFRLGESRKVEISDHHYDSVSNTLIFHGHQLDYNNILDSNGKKVSCIDGLTVAINNYLAQTPDSERKLKAAQDNGLWSYWYPYGGLPKFIEDTSRLFGNDPRKYEEEIAKFLSGPELEKWLEAQKGGAVKFIGRITQLLSNWPRTVMSLYKPFYHIMGQVVQSRIKKILNGKTYPDIPDFCLRYPISNLVISHSHIPREHSYGNKRFLDIASPRVHPKIVGNYVHARRAYDCLLINRERLVRDTREENRWLPLEIFS